MAMYDRGKNLRSIGIIVAISAIVFLALFTWLTERWIGRGWMDATVVVPTAERLKAGDPVLFRGVRVGKVRTLRFDPSGRVAIRIRLDSEVPLTTGASAGLEAVDVFGAQSVVLRDLEPTGRPLQEGAVIPGRSGGTLPDRARALGDQAAKFLADSTLARVYGLLDQGARATEAFQQTMQTTRSAITGQVPRLGSTLEELQSLIRALRTKAGSEEVDRLLARIDTVSSHLVTISAGMERSVSDLGGVLARMNDGSGTVARLLDDPALYDRTLGTMTALEALLVDIRANPKKYVSVSVF